MSDPSRTKVVAIPSGAGYSTGPAPTEPRRPTRSKSRGEASPAAKTGTKQQAKKPQGRERRWSFPGSRRSTVQHPQPIKAGRRSKTMNGKVVDVQPVASQTKAMVKLNDHGTDIDGVVASGVANLAIPNESVVKVPRALIQMPSGTLPPLYSGWPKFKWAFCRTFRVRDRQNVNALRVPKPSAKEQRRRDLDHGLALNITLTHHLMNIPGKRRRIVVYNPKGTSGKTRDALAIGSNMAKYSGKPVLYMPFTLQTTKGDAKTMAGIPVEQQRSISWVYRHLAEFTDAEALGNLLPNNSAGLFIITEDRVKDPEKLPFTPAMLFRILEILGPLMYGGVVIDMANEGVRPDNFTEQEGEEPTANVSNFVLDALLKATSLVMPFLASSPVSRTSVVDSLEELYVEPELVNDRADRYAHIKHIRDHVLLVANAVKGADPFDFNWLLAKTWEELKDDHPRIMWETTSTPFWGELSPEQNELGKTVVYTMNDCPDDLALADAKLTVATLIQGLVLDGTPVPTGIKPDLSLASDRLGRNVRYLQNYVPRLSDVDPALQSKGESS